MVIAWMHLPLFNLKLVLLSSKRIVSAGHTGNGRPTSFLMTTFRLIAVGRSDGRNHGHRSLFVVYRDATGNDWCESKKMRPIKTLRSSGVRICKSRVSSLVRLDGVSQIGNENTVKKSLGMDVRQKCSLESPFLASVPIKAVASPVMRIYASPRFRRFDIFLFAAFQEDFGG